MRKYTEKEKAEYWMARCPECGWKGLTVDCCGFKPIPLEGDYEDGYCPRCGGVVGEDDEEPRRYLFWIFRRLAFYKTRKDLAEKRWIRNMERKVESER